MREINNVECAVCGKPLRAWVDEQDGTVIVYPCPFCVKDEARRLSDDSYDYGFERGYSACLEEQKFVPNYQPKPF